MPRPTLASLLEDFRNWNKTQDWMLNKQRDIYGNEDPDTIALNEKLAGIGTADMGMLGSSVGGLAGIFAGAKSRMSDLKALDLAKQLEKSGEDPRKIWADTGWFKAPWDKRWRYEISDEAMKSTPAKWQPTIAGTNIQETELGQAYSHPDLYSAYPHMSVAELYADPTISSKALYQTGPVGEDMISVKMDRPKETQLLQDYFDRMRDKKSPDYWKSTAAEDYFDQSYPTYREALKENLKYVKQTKRSLADMLEGYMVPREHENLTKSPVIHEIQHAIQDLEGFARGGSSEEFTAGGLINPATGKQYTMEEADALYRRMGGEVEARLAQKRMDYPALYRRFMYPLDESQLDVPLSEVYSPKPYFGTRVK